MLEYDSAVLFSCLPLMAMHCSTCTHYVQYYIIALLYGYSLCVYILTLSQEWNGKCNRFATSYIIMCVSLLRYCVSLSYGSCYFESLTPVQVKTILGTFSIIVCNLVNDVSVR